jgi:hypothetical protein
MITIPDPYLLLLDDESTYMGFLSLLFKIFSFDIKWSDPNVTENPTTYHSNISIIPSDSITHIVSE